MLIFGSESWVLSTAMEKTSEGEHTGFPKKNQGESGTSDGGQEIGDTSGRGSAVSGGDIVGSHLNWLHTGDGGPVGGAAADFRGLYRGEGLQGGGGGVEGHMVESGGSRYSTQGNLGGYIKGFLEKVAEREGHIVWDRIR